jgi:hypothetical protein
MARVITYPEYVEVGPAGTTSGHEYAANLSGVTQSARARKALVADQMRACFEPRETVSRFRPFFRRRDSTARPQRSDMRNRNPCLAIRRLFRGRYVGIIAVYSFQ